MFRIKHIFVHDWTDWKTISYGKLLTMDNDQVGLVKIQERVCNVCKKVQMNTASTDIRRVV